MLKVYEDKNYENPEIIEQIDNMKIKINRHGSTLVIVCIVKMLDILIAICENAIKMGDKISSK